MPGFKPAIGPDGRIYYGHASGLMVMEPSGDRKWLLESGSGASDPKIGPDGTAYLTTGEGFCAFKEGQVKWTIPKYYHCLGIAKDGTLYVLDDNKLHALTPNGVAQWTYDGGIFSDLAIGPDGTLYIRMGAEIQAVTPAGKWKWTYKAGFPTSPPIVGGADTIFTVVTDGSNSRLTAVNPDGTKKWQGSAITGQFGNLVIGPGGVFYALADPKPAFGINPPVGPKVISLDATGQQQWSFPLPYTSTNPYRPAGLIVGADGLVYVGHADGKLYAIRPDGTQAWVCALGGDILNVAPVMGLDGVIYTASTNRNFYAVYSSSLGVAHSPWPMTGHDPQRTYRASGGAMMQGLTAILSLLLFN